MNRSFLLLVIAILGLYIPVYSQTTCNTTNASISTSVNGQTVTLVDKSTVPTGSGYRIDYTVNWGDGICSGYSQLTNPVTHTYACSGTYTVKLTVGVFDYSINMYCVITQASSYVYINGPSYLDCSKVKAAMAVSVSGSDVTLVNNSVPTKYCNQITNYNVTWGDPNGAYGTSNIGTYKHTYKNSGTYNIRMVFDIKDHIKTCPKDTVDTTVSVTVIPGQQPNLITGNIVTDKNSISPNDSVKLWLLIYDSTSKLYSAVDSFAEPASQIGYTMLRFENKPSGAYVLKAEMMDKSNGRINIPTYSTDRLYWTYPAVHYHTGGTINNASVVMRQGRVTTGSGVITGNIKHEGSQVGVEGLNVLLLDVVNLPVAYAVTDATGNYYFDNLPDGPYSIHPEQLNYNTTTSTLNISASQSVHNGVDFRRYTGDKVIIPVPSSVNDLGKEQQLFSLYPNPAKSTVTLIWGMTSNKNATVTLTDVSGKKVFSNDVQMNDKVELDVSTLHTGFYMINVTTEQGSTTQKLIIQ